VTGGNVADEGFVSIATWQAQKAAAEADGDLARVGELDAKINARIKASEAFISIQENERRREWAKWVTHATPITTDGQTLYVCEACDTTAPARCDCDWR